MKKPKIVLFMPARVDAEVGDLPSADLIPLEFLHIAPMATQAGWDVQVIDSMVEHEKSLELVLEACEDADAFGSSCILGYQVFDGANVAAAVKERFPKLPIVWGGWWIFRSSST